VQNRRIVSDSLGNRKKKEAETNANIVDVLKHTSDETKNCRNNQQRVEFHIALACVMPERETQGTLDRVVDDLSGLTFQEWDPSAGSDDTSTQVIRWKCSSTRANYAQRTSTSRK
jgi:hypothetical protein